MISEETENELGTPLIDELARIHQDATRNSPNPDENVAKAMDLNSSATSSELGQHHLCENGRAHGHHHHHRHRRHQRRSRHIESSEMTTINENTQQNIYTNHPDDQSDLDEVPNAPRLPKRPQMMKLPCRNRYSCHEHNNHHHHHHVGHHNHGPNTAAPSNTRSCHHMRAEATSKPLVTRQSSNDRLETVIDKTEEIVSDTDAGPPLPPRPPIQRQRFTLSMETVPQRSGLRKYVICCLICGGISTLLGFMFLGVYFLERSYTSTVAFFETVPTFLPATLLILTGLCIISLARRRNRYSYLIKLSGACGLASALTCALVTVTTTVLHMSRLQALRECEYTRKTRTCTCYSIETGSLQDDGGIDESVRFVFDASDDCTIVHSALYSCLRAVFGLSVAGVLVAVFSCMLVYQLLSHERKKMYWEQLELRCRSIYAPPPPQAQPLPPPPAMTNTASIIETSRNGGCRCCEQCHSHRAIIQPTFPWETDNRFWTPAPTMGGNFYSPNPGRDDAIMATRVQQQHGLRSQRPGWSWPRLPWQRNDSTNQRMRQTPSSPDSQYGFSNQSSRMDNSALLHGQNGYTLINGPIQHYGIWGPPPPYSDPNSPARRGRHLYNLANPCQQMIEQATAVQTHQVQSPIVTLECHQRTSASMDHLVENHHIEVNTVGSQSQTLHRYKKSSHGLKAKDPHDSSVASDSESTAQRPLTHSNTLPFRKAKRRNDVTSKSVGPHQSTHTRPNVHSVFDAAQHIDTAAVAAGCSDGSHGGQCPNTKRRKNGVDNTAFNPMEDVKSTFNVAESEVYFGDVSSCCNNSTKNDNFYDDNGQTGQRNVETVDEYVMQQRFNQNDELPSSTMSNRLGFSTKPDYMKLTSDSAKHNARNANRQSMCSMDSGEKTDVTDLSPLTPTTPYGMADPNTSTVATKPNQRNTPLSAHPYGNLAAVFNDIIEPSSSTYHVSREAHPRTIKLYSEVHLDAEIPVNLNTSSELNRSRKSGSANSSLNSSMHSFHSGKYRTTATPSNRPSRMKPRTNAMHNNDVNDIDLMYADANSDDSSEHEHSESTDIPTSNGSQWMEKNVGNSSVGDRRL